MTPIYGKRMLGEEKHAELTQKEKASGGTAGKIVYGKRMRADQPEKQPEKQPTGTSGLTVAKIKEFIDANPDQAVAAAEAELGQEDPRVTLLGWLHGQIEVPGNEELLERIVAVVNPEEAE